MSDNQEQCEPASPVRIAEPLLLFCAIDTSSVELYPEWSICHSYFLLAAFALALQCSSPKTRIMALP